MEVRDLIKAISHTMQCDQCPLRECKAREHSSQANCDKHWFDALTNAELLGKLRDAKWDRVRDLLA